MDNLRVYAKKVGSNEKLQGTGINIFEDKAILYDRYASYEVEPETILLRRGTYTEKYENPQTDNNLTFKLHEKLVQTIIDFMVENEINDIDEVQFSADSLQISKMHNKWSPSTDSSLTLIGYQDGKRKEINKSL